MNGAFGQKAYTLDECIQAALTNNVRMKNANNELEMAKQDKKKAFTNYFPSVSAAGTGFMADKGLMQMSLGPDMNMSMLKNGIAGGVGASLPLFTGGQIVNGNQLAKVGVEVKRLQRNLSDNEVCLTTEQYFWRVVILKEKLKTLSKVEAQLARILSDVEASVQAGIVTRNDLLQVQLRQNETKSTRLQVENALSVSQTCWRSTPDFRLIPLTWPLQWILSCLHAPTAFIAIRNRHWDLPANMPCCNKT